MAQPFTLTLLPDAKPPTLKPGWHKRALAADRRHRVTTAPQRGNPDADAKAVQYALWLAARDGIAIPADDAVARVDWQPCAHGVRPCAVEWMPAPQPYRPAARGMAQPAVAPLLRIELPHWDYEASAVVETTLLDWSAPIVIELPAADHAETVAVLDPCEPVTVAEPCEPAPIPADVPPAGHIEPFAICPAVGMPCKVDCGFRSGCGSHAPEAIATVGAPEAIGEARTVTALCLSQRARAKLLRRVGAVPPAVGHAAKGGAFALTLSEARVAADVKCVRLIGMPRKPYTRRDAPAPIVTTPTRANWDHPREFRSLSWQMAHRSCFAMSPQPYR